MHVAVPKNITSSYHHIVRRIPENFGGLEVKEQGVEGQVQGLVS